MKIQALITMLVVGSSSVAMARPATVSGHAEWTYETKPAPIVVRDHRTPMPAPVVEPVRYNKWRHGGMYHQQPQAVQLGSGLNLGQGRKFITVGESMGRFDTLRLDAFSGLTLIEQVYIEFGNGQEQVIRGINRVLDGRSSLTLDLDGRNRAIKRIVVYGKPQFRQTFGFRAEPSAFSISAM